MRQDKLKSAKSRLMYAKENYLGKHPDLEPQLVYLECKVARKEKADDLMAEKVAYLHQRYPDSDFTKLAGNLLERKSFVFYILFSPPGIDRGFFYSY